MPDIPSGALAAAAVTAVALSRLVAALGRRLPVPIETSGPVALACRRIERVAAGRASGPEEIGAIGQDLAAAIQAIARAADPADAASALYETAAASRLAPPSSASPVLTASYEFARAFAVGLETTCLGEAFLAEARSAFTDRRAADAARARINAACEAAYDRIGAVLGQDIAAVLGEVARRSSGHLVELATSLQPVVQVQSQRSAPSTALAWSLYGDPARAAELVRRNRCGTPLFMPAAIEAVAPAAE